MSIQLYVHTDISTDVVYLPTLPSCSRRIFSFSQLGKHGKTEIRVHVNSVFKRSTSLLGRHGKTAAAVHVAVTGRHGKTDFIIHETTWTSTASVHEKRRTTAGVFRINATNATPISPPPKFIKRHPKCNTSAVLWFAKCSHLQQVCIETVVMSLATCWTIFD